NVRSAPAEVAPIYQPTPPRPPEGSLATGSIEALPVLPPPPEEGSAQNVSTVAKTPEPGEEAPYEAYDQGKYLTALELAAKAAEKGDPQAHTLIGRIYAEGAGTRKDLRLAAKWYARGAELGDAHAMFAYGLLLAEGQGVTKNRAAAAQMFE